MASKPFSQLSLTSRGSFASIDETSNRDSSQSSLVVSGENSPSPLNLGILRLDGWGDANTTGTGSTGYVPIRGDVDDKRSFQGKYGMVATIAKNCTWEALKDPELWNDQKHLDSIRNSVANAFVALLENDVDVIIANCGLFMWLHAKGIATPAMDMAIEAMGDRRIKPRPLVSLSTLVTLPNYMTLCGLGRDQRRAIMQSKNAYSKAIIAVFTSDENACIGIMKATKQLEGANIFIHSDPPEKKSMGGILVVGLNAEDVVGTGKVNGFEIVNNGTPAFYEVLNPSIRKVARAVKEKYPTVAIGIVECTEVGAYTDTIRSELRAPVIDPIIQACNLMNALVPHDYTQVNCEDRRRSILRSCNWDSESPADEEAEELRHCVRIVTQYTNRALLKTPKLLRPLRTKYTGLVNGTADGNAAKNTLLKVVKKMKKQNPSCYHDFETMEHIFNTTTNERLIEILKHGTATESRLPSSIIDLVHGSSSLHFQDRASSTMTKQASLSQFMSFRNLESQKPPASKRQLTMTKEASLAQFMSIRNLESQKPPASKRQLTMTKEASLAQFMSIRNL